LCRLPDLIQTYIVLFDLWEPDVTSLIRERLQPGDVFIDIGANVGHHSLQAASAVGKNGSVVAIEALPSNFSILQQNIAASNSGNIRTIHRAVSDAPGFADVYAGSPHNTGLATTAPQKRRKLKLEARVQAAQLANCLQQVETEHARLVKIDVEGGE